MAAIKSDPMEFCDILQANGSGIFFRKDESDNITPYFDYINYQPNNKKIEVPYLVEPGYANDKPVGYASAFIRINRDHPFIGAPTQYLRFGIDVDFTSGNNAWYTTLHIVDIKIDPVANKVHDVHNEYIRQCSSSDSGELIFFDYLDEHFREYDHIYHIGGELKSYSRYRLTSDEIARQKLIIRTNI